MKKILVAMAFFILISTRPQLCVVDCQIVLENGIRVTDLWLKFLFDYFPQYFPGQLMATPTIFLSQVRGIETKNIFNRLATNVKCPLILVI